MIDGKHSVFNTDSIANWVRAASVHRNEVQRSPNEARRQS